VPIGKSPWIFVGGIGGWIKAQMKGLDKCINVVRFLSGRNKGFQRKWDSKNRKQRVSAHQNLPKLVVYCWLKVNFLLKTVFAFTDNHKFRLSSLFVLYFSGSHFLWNPLFLPDKNLTTLIHSSKPFIWAFIQPQIPPTKIQGEIWHHSLQLEFELWV